MTSVNAAYAGICQKHFQTDDISNVTARSDDESSRQRVESTSQRVTREDESTTAALRHFAQSQPSLGGFNVTAEFPELVRRWLNICKVKSQYMAMRLDDDNCVPLRINCEKSEASLQFLEDFGRFMREWLDSEIPATAKLPKDASMALFYISAGVWLVLPGIS